MAFHSCKAYGEKAEDMIRNWLGGEKLPPYDPRGDFLWAGLSIEIKSEQRHTGNLFIEVESSATRLGWVHTLECDLIAYVFPEVTYWIPFQPLKSLALEGSWRKVIQGKYKQRNITSGLLVPISNVIARCGVVADTGCGRAGLIQALNHHQLDSHKATALRLLCADSDEPDSDSPHPVP